MFYGEEINLIELWATKITSKVEHSDTGHGSNNLKLKVLGRGELKISRSPVNPLGRL